MDRKHVEAVIQIRAKAALLDAVQEVAVGRGEDAHVDFDGLAAADAFKLTLLQHAQEFRLQVGRDLAHFVEQERAAIGEFKAAFALLRRTGEGAAFVSK